MNHGKFAEIKQTLVYGSYFHFDSNYCSSSTSVKSNWQAPRACQTVRNGLAICWASIGNRKKV